MHRQSMSNLKLKLWIDTEGDRFIDTDGRQVILRGVNLGGDCKLPYPNGGTHLPSDFSDHRDVSFIGRPFPLEEADEHFARLKNWGFNTLRLLTTWEAIAHAGPGQYDEAYLDYFAEIARRAGEHGYVVFIDFHQDAWSRMSGGSGAPGWTFEALGLDFTKFDAAGAAHVMQHKFDYGDPSPHQTRYPMMSWPSNYGLAANGIMWTAFFAGETLTPHWKIGDVNVQTYLQDHYLGALGAVAQRVVDMAHVIGFDTLNEPGLGFIGQSLSEPNLATTSDGPFPVTPGPRWTPLTNLLAARGQTVRVPVLEKSETKGRLKRSEDLVVNASRTSIWLPAVADPFEAHGAYRLEGDALDVLDEDFFRLHNGAAIDHENDLMAPFFARVSHAMRAHRPDWLVFAELSPYVLPTGRGFPKQMPEKSVNAGHWYDINLLRTKEHQAKNDPETLKNRYRLQLGYIKYLSSLINSGAPTLIGEFGIPYDMNGAAAYDAWARGGRGEVVWAQHAEVLANTYDVLDELLLSGTQWNYTASNRNDLRIGDGWNQEDLSIFSIDQVTSSTDLNSGGRAIDGFCRPYVQRVQGVLHEMRYDRGARSFEASYDANIAIEAPTEIFTPRGVFADAISIEVSKPVADWSYDPNLQLLKLWVRENGDISVRMRRSASTSLKYMQESASV